MLQKLYLLLLKQENRKYISVNFRSISGYEMKQSNYQNIPKDVQEVVAEGQPLSLEDELEVKGLKIAE